MQKTENQIKLEQALPNAKSFECQNCKSIFFKQVVVLKEISKIILASPENVTVPIPIYRCDDCGDILEALLPPINIFNAKEEPKSGLITQA